MAYQLVPVFARLGLQNQRVIVKVLPHPPQGDMQHQAGKTRVRDQQVAAAAKHKKGQAAFASKAHRLQNVGFARSLGKPPRRPADFESCIGRERNVLEKFHPIEGISPGVGPRHPSAPN